MIWSMQVTRSRVYAYTVLLGLDVLYHVCFFLLHLSLIGIALLLILPLLFLDGVLSSKIGH